MARTPRPAAQSVKARAYTSPTLVLLAMDWPGGADHPDFLGFAIQRTPGFAPGQVSGYLLNKIGFHPPKPGDAPHPSDRAPIQKFLWWDSAINDADRGGTFTYTVTPVTGTGPDDLHLQHDAEAAVPVTLPHFERDGIWTCFNRAVVSSQAFKREFPHPQADLDRCMAWLANGMQDAFPALLSDATDVTGAIYHLTDKEWVLPALQAFPGTLSLVYQDQPRDRTSAAAVAMLAGPRFTGYPRGKTRIMHDKFLVDRAGGRVLAGSANFTPEGMTSQANLLHIFNSPELAGLFAARAALIQPDPAIAQTARGAAWSQPVLVGPAQVRVFFSPEPTGHRASIDTVVQAVQAARSSVVFCMFDPTDAALLQALLATGDRGRLLYGLLNSIADPGAAADDGSPDEVPAHPASAAQVKVELFNRSKADHQVLAYNLFPARQRARWLPARVQHRGPVGPQHARRPGSGRRPSPARGPHPPQVRADRRRNGPADHLHRLRQPQQELHQFQRRIPAGDHPQPGPGANLPG